MLGITGLATRLRIPSQVSSRDISSPSSLNRLGDYGLSQTRYRKKFPRETYGEINAERCNSRWKREFKKKPCPALPIFAMITSLCSTGCTKNLVSTPIAEDGQSLLETTSNGEEELDKADFRCHGQDPSETPVLYAHFLEKSFQEEFCREDLLDSDLGAIECAPGPIFLKHQNAVDADAKEWVLPAVPDYFAWHLGRKASIDETIYIANANGFPIKSQTIKLENERDSTLVLFLKTSLAPRSRYYIYLVLNTPDSQKRWLQPLSIAPGPDENPPE